MCTFTELFQEIPKINYKYLSYVLFMSVNVCSDNSVSIWTIYLLICCIYDEAALRNVGRAGGWEGGQVFAILVILATVGK